MRYKHLINANVDVSALAVGTWSLGNCGYGKVDDNNSVSAIRTMLDGGVNLIDTAPIYGAGYSEKIVGKAIHGLDRSKFFISTKCVSGSTTVKGRRTGDGNARDGSYANVLFECEQSLRRLNTDYIDFYFVHWPDYDVPFSETMEAMNYLKKQGLIRFVGLSNFNETQITECQKVCKIDVIQPPYSMVVRRDEKLMKWAKERGIGSFTYASLGSGILTGAFRTLPTFDAADPRSGDFYPFFKEPQFSKVMKVLDVMDEISAETGKPLAQIAINWSTQKEYVSTALCGVVNTREAKENCATFDWSLSEEQINKIDNAIQTYIDFDGAPGLK